MAEGNFVVTCIVLPRILCVCIKGNTVTWWLPKETANERIKASDESGFCLTEVLFWNTALYMPRTSQKWHWLYYSLCVPQGIYKETPTNNIKAPGAKNWI